MGTIHIIRMNNVVEQKESDEAPSLKEMQGVVGGLIEVVNLNYKGKPALMVVNEEGRILGLPVNMMATDIRIQDIRNRGGVVMFSDLPDMAIVGDAILLEDIDIE